MVLFHNRPPGAYIVLATLLLCCLPLLFSQPLSPSLQSLSNRWEIPDRFEYMATIDTLTTIVRNIQLRLKISYHGTSIGLLDTVPACYVHIKNETVDERVATPIPRQNLSQGLNLSLYIDNKYQSLETSLTWVCTNVMLERPNDFEPSDPVAQVEVTIVDTTVVPQTGLPRDIPLHSETLTHTFVDQPFLSHVYTWSDKSEVAVDFIFYRPTTLPGSQRFYLDHPLLNANVITTMHSSPDVTPFDSFYRPYSVLPIFQSEISCKDLSSALTFGHAGYHLIDGRFVLDIEFDTERASYGRTPFACSFQLKYPADVVMRAIQSVSNSIPTATIVMNPSSSSSDQPISIPLYLPREIMLNDSASTSFGGIFMWRLPHHTQTATSFEFGLASTPLALRFTGEVRVVEPATVKVGVSSGTSRYTQFTPQDASILIACRQHGDEAYPDPIPFPADGLHMLDEQFHRFGVTCRIDIADLPPSVTLAHGLIVEFTTGDRSNNSVYVNMFNSLHQSDRSVYETYLQDLTTVKTDQLPSMASISFTAAETPSNEDDGGSTINAVGKMHLQYLLQHPPLSVRTQMTITLIFPDFIYLGSIIDLSNHRPTNRYFSKIIIKSQGYTIFTKDEHPITYGLDDFTSLIDSVDPIAWIFQPAKGIRAPSISFGLPVLLDSSQPLDIEIQFSVRSDLDIDTTRVFAILSPNPFQGVYMPQHAIITSPPASPIPLAEYSYRCVTWDKMAAPYVYGASSPLPLTDDNSFPCPSHISPDTQEIDVSDSTIWRRIEHVSKSTSRQVSQPYCYYELAAVCVTSSADNSEYNVHPLSHCPSTLDRHHAIPCRVVDNPSNWSYTASEFKVSYTQAKDTLTVSWDYFGDARLAWTVEMAATPQHDGTATTTEDVDHSAWVVVATDLPAYLGDGNDFDLYTTTSLQLPRFNEEMNTLHLRLSLNAIPVVELSATIDYTPPVEYTYGCFLEHNKIFDSSTQLCICEPGFKPSVPAGIENPWIKPTEFTCIPICNQAAGYEWSTATNQCENIYGKCDNYGALHVPTDLCICFDGFVGDMCEHPSTHPEYLCTSLQCVQEHTYHIDGGEECHIVEDQTDEAHVLNNDAEDGLLTCNCLDEYTGAHCQHEAVCSSQVDSCVNGSLTSGTDGESGTDSTCLCVCNSEFIDGDSCDICTLPCKNDGMPNTSCSQCICPTGYIGEYCQTPVWFHRFVFDNLPQSILDLITDHFSNIDGDSAEDTEHDANTSTPLSDRLASIRRNIVRLLIWDYADVLEDLVITIDDSKFPTSVSLDDDMKHSKLHVDFSRFDIIFPNANDNDDNNELNDNGDNDEEQQFPHLFLELMTYPVDFNDDTIAIATTYGVLDPDWSRLSTGLDRIKAALEDYGMIPSDAETDDDIAIVPEIIDATCITESCRAGNDDGDSDDDNGEEEEEHTQGGDDSSGNTAFSVITSSFVSIMITLVTMVITLALT